MDKMNKLFKRHSGSKSARHSEGHSPVSRFQGVSVDFLIDFNDRILAGLEARDVQLFECVADFEADMVNYTLSVKAGDTVSFMTEISADKWQGSIANVGIGTFNPRILRPKVREEWTLNDIREYAIKPQTKEKQNCYLENMQKRHVGKSFKGMFVISDPEKTGFHALVNAIGNRFDSSECKPDERYVWLDVFSTNQHVSEKARVSSLSKTLLTVFGKFTERFMFYSQSPGFSNVYGTKNKKFAQSTVSTEVMIGGHHTTICMDCDLVVDFHRTSSLLPLASGSEKKSLKSMFWTKGKKTEPGVGEFLLTKKQMLSFFGQKGQKKVKMTEKSRALKGFLSRKELSNSFAALNRYVPTFISLETKLDIPSWFRSGKGGQHAVTPCTADELYWADMAKKEAKKESKIVY
eukprot:CAMPEP_0184017260 /NCGR_PEP_ID=MMETSP0954-20121128/7425_1 /TAXON_ID=627963 /ORGANISM="Aplanochytrium sp, Strain PBS07" /LENGTH=405 /DNA_ID=CAMNT_0026298451 /DNA_START=188 /DNA_END=1405 /DNA_ORIENTATION=-